VKWTYKLVDGRCTDSLALETAREFKIDSKIISRAEELGILFDKLCRPSDAMESGNSSDGSVRGKIPRKRATKKGVAASETAEATIVDVDVNATEAVQVEGSQDVLSSAAASYKLEDVLGTIQNVVTALDPTVPMDPAEAEEEMRRRTTIIEHGYNPPPGFEGKSCVYVLHITRRQVSVSV
jgi:hypothetical protein